MMRFEGHGLACIRGERLVFAELDFALTARTVLVLIGRNGTGKSSLLRLAAGLIPPVAGTLGWHDGSVADDPARHRARLHYVGHQDAVKPALTVRENLAAWPALRGGTAAVHPALAAFGLEALADAPARYLSAGQRRRLALARLCASPAPLWLLDEPTVALDRESVAALHHALARHRAGGGMAMIATNVDLGIADTQLLALGDFASVSQSEMDGTGPGAAP